jgi:VanZ family protein
VKWSRIALPIYWIALAAATHYPTVRIPGGVSYSDKIIHFAAFGVLAYLLWHALARARPLTSAPTWITALVLISYSAVDEYAQRFVGRHSEYADWIANIAGITCVLATLEIRRRIRAQRR